MGLSKVKEIIDNFDSIQTWSIHMMRIKGNVNASTSYFCRQIRLVPEESLFTLVTDVKAELVKKTNEVNEVLEFAGTFENSNIYELPTTDESITESCASLVTAIENTDIEKNPFDIKANAYAVIGSLEGKNIFFVFLQNPVKTIKRKYMLTDNGAFKEVNNKILSLGIDADLLIYDETAYFLSVKAEKVLGLERTYLKICKRHIEEIAQSDILIDITPFENIAKFGCNPRRFMAYSQRNMERLKKKEVRKRIANSFSIPLKNGKFDVANPADAENLVKIICQKGMIDPFDSEAREVSGARKWRTN